MGEVDWFARNQKLADEIIGELYRVLADELAPGQKPEVIGPALVTCIEAAQGPDALDPYIQRAIHRLFPGFARGGDG